MDGLPGNVEADTVAHCGPSARGEFCRTLTVVDIATGWTGERLCLSQQRVRELSKAEETIEGRMPFRIRPYDTDNGSEFINRDLIAWLQERDIEQTRSRPYRKNDRATVESRTTTSCAVTRSTTGTRSTSSAFSTSYGSWCASRPTCSPCPRSPSAGPAPRRAAARVYDEPHTPWERLKEFDEKDRAAGGPGFILPGKREEIGRIIATTNPAELVRRIHAIQDRLEALAAPRTAQLARRAGPDMAYLNKTLARIAGVEPEDDETRQADED